MRTMSTSSTDEGGIENLNNPYPPPRAHEARACMQKGVGMGINNTYNRGTRLPTMKERKYPFPYGIVT